MKKYQVNFIGNKGQKKPLRESLVSSGKLVICSFIFIIFSIFSMNLLSRQEPYRPILRSARAALLPVKNFHFFEGAPTDWFGGSYKLREFFSICESGKKLETNLNPMEYIAYNTMNLHFNKTAIITMFLSDEFAKKKAEVSKDAWVSVIKKRKNYGYSFMPVSYKEYFASSGKWSEDGFESIPDHPQNPQLMVNQGLPRQEDGQEMMVKRVGTDGKVRWYKEKEPMFIVTPNVYGNLTDEAPPLEPEQVLPIFLSSFSDLYKKGEWNQEAVKNYLVVQYYLYSGIELEIEKIEIVGKDIRTRFLYHGDFPKNETNVSWYKNTKAGQEIIRVPVKLVNGNKELLYFNSTDPSQSIVLPISMLKKLENDDFMLAANGTVFTFNDVLEEMNQAIENAKAQVLPLYPETKDPPRGIRHASLVVKTKRHEIIANELIGTAKSDLEGLMNIKSFYEQTNPYLTDDKLFSSNVDISMTPLNTFINGGGDCEDHAIPFASSVFSATRFTEKFNRTVGLHETSFINTENEIVGHMTALIKIPGRKPTTFPFSDHVAVPDEGKLEPYFNIETTGLGDDRWGVTSISKKAFESNLVQIISGIGSERFVAVAGVFDYHYLR